MKKILLVIIVCTMFMGCATTKYELVHPEKSTVTFYAEKLECEEKANALGYQRYPMVMPQPSTNIAAGGDTAVVKNGSGHYNSYRKNPDVERYSRANYIDQALNDCLYSKGWEHSVIEEKD